MSDILNPIAALYQSNTNTKWQNFINSKIDASQLNQKLLFSIFGEIHIVSELSESFNGAKQFWNFPFSIDKNIIYPAISYASIDANENYHTVRIYNNEKDAENSNALLSQLRAEYSNF